MLPITRLPFDFAQGSPTGVFTVSKAAFSGRVELWKSPDSGVLPGGVGGSIVYSRGKKWVKVGDSVENTRSRGVLFFLYFTNTKQTRYQIHYVYRRIHPCD